MTRGLVAGRTRLRRDRRVRTAEPGLPVVRQQVMAVTRVLIAALARTLIAEVFWTGVAELRGPSAGTQVVVVRPLLTRPVKPRVLKLRGRPVTVLAGTGALFVSIRPGP
jgi:hypothetical protein